MIASFHFVDEDQVLVEAIYRKLSGEYVPVATLVLYAGGPESVFERVFEIMNGQELIQGECIQHHFNPKTLRSMMVGDCIQTVGDEIYLVANSGFERMSPLPTWTH